MAQIYELKKKKKKSRLLKIAVSVLLLALISVIAAMLITNNGRLDLDGFKRLFNGMSDSNTADMFSFDSGAGSVFADMDGGLAVCSGTGLQVYNTSAKRIFGEAFEMTTPTICSGGDLSAVYDLGGRMLKIFDLYGVTHSISTEKKIISATLNKNDWLALCTQESGGYKGKAAVYDSAGEERFYWNSANGYILSAVVAPDNKSLAVLTLTEQGSRVVVLSLSSGDEERACLLPDELVLEVRYINNDRILAVSRDGLTNIKADGTAEKITDYSEQYLFAYADEGGGFATLAINDYLVGEQGRIVTVDFNGRTLGTLEVTRKILSVSARDDNLAILYSDGLVIYDKYLKERASFENDMGAEQTIMRNDGKALLITAHSARVCSIQTG